MKVLTSAKKMSGTESAVSGSVDELALAKKLVIIVATDFACWVRECPHQATEKNIKDPAKMIKE